VERSEHPRKREEPYRRHPGRGANLLIEQDSPAVIVFRRSEHDFVREVHEGLRAVIPLPEIDAELPLAEVYEGVEFAPEAAGEAEPLA
jgi:Uma2 family endonuclease